MEHLVTLTGVVAGILTTLSALPQVIKTYRSRHTKDLSLGMLAMLATGVLLWSVYGVFIDEPTIIVANVVSFMLVFYVLVMKIRLG